MSTIIYYFSGTGNSLKVAKDIAAKLKDTVNRGRYHHPDILVTEIFHK